MPVNLTTEIDKQIAEMERQLAALRSARAILGGRGARTSGAPVAGRRRRKFSAAQRAEISRRMKAAWAKRRATK
jgi:hypothetical protein